MCSLRTPSRPALTALMLCITAAPAICAPLTLVEQGRIFAECAGRYSAETEHLWVIDAPRSGGPAGRRDAFSDLTEAIIPDLPRDLAGNLMGLRVSAKAAQRHLLNRATFGTRETERQRAAALASGFIAACDGLLPAAS